MVYKQSNGQEEGLRMQAWEEFLKRLEKDLGLKTSNKWLRTLKVVDFDACNLYLEASNALHILWFEEHVRKEALATLRNNNNHPIKVHLTSSSGDALKKKQRKVLKSSHFQEISKPFSIISDPLDPRATFETFIQAKENEYPLKFLSKIASGQQLATFNPLYLCGGKSVGKSHLLMALCRSLREAGLKVHFAHTQTFTEHYISAIRLSKMEHFRSSYREVDVLILDDIHVLARRSATQEELFHTFNALHSFGKQIVLSSHISPSGLTEIEPRLISRFEWGLTLEIKSLKHEHRETLIKRRSTEANFPLSEDVAPFLVQTFPSTQSLLIAFDALLMRAEDKKISSVDVAQTQILLQDLIAAIASKEMTPKHIISYVAEHFDVEKSDLLGKAQTKEFSLPRQVAMYFCRYELKMPFKQIGRVFSRDHSTVMSSIRYIQKRLDIQDKEMCTSISEVHKKMQKD